MCHFVVLLSVFAKKIPNISEENELSFAQRFNIISNGVYHINMFHVLVQHDISVGFSLIPKP